MNIGGFFNTLLAHASTTTTKPFYLSSFRRTTPSWKEIARNKSELVSKLLKGYDKRIRPYTGGKKDLLSSSCLHIIPYNEYIPYATYLPPAWQEFLQDRK